MMQYFDQLDLDGSGSLTLDEMHFHSEVMRSSPEVSNSHKLLQKLVKDSGIDVEMAESAKARQAAERLQNQGRYLSATFALERIASNVKLGAHLDDNAHRSSQSVETVVEQVCSLVKLAEMKWRCTSHLAALFVTRTMPHRMPSHDSRLTSRLLASLQPLPADRVVDVGCSPREESLRNLATAQQLLEQCKAGRADDGEDQPASCVDGSDPDRQLASLHAAVLHGQAVTRLIFDEIDDKAAEDIGWKLEEARKLREEGGEELQADLAETLNSLGLLRQRRGEYEEAEGHFLRSLKLRQREVQGRSAQVEQAREQAQSFVSLGNLAMARADAMAAQQQVDEHAQNAFYEQALEHLNAAKEAYVRGFHENHPKVAWALEGLGKVHEKMGNLTLAVAELKAASEIRSQLQAQTPGKQMFQKELGSLEQRLAKDVTKLKLATKMRQVMVTSNVTSDWSNRESEKDGATAAADAV